MAEQWYYQSAQCTICGSKESRFIKNQEAKGLLIKLRIKTPLSKISILGDIFFELGTQLQATYKNEWNCE